METRVEWPSISNFVRHKEVWSHDQDIMTSKVAMQWPLLSNLCKARKGSVSYVLTDKNTVAFNTKCVKAQKV